MAFLSIDVAHIFLNRFVVVIGDSIQRGIYKDLVLLLQNNRYLTEQELRNKGELEFLGDTLVEGGHLGEMTNGINYREVRQYHTDVHLIRFYFVTRCYNDYVESILSDLQKEPNPDLVIMNSCLWDITRYGKSSITEYKGNLTRIFERFFQCLPKHCLVLWNTTLPISSKARGGFLVPEIDFMTSTLRLDIIEANNYAKDVISRFHYDILDLHFYLRHHLHRRVRDGIHWDMVAHRHITQLILNHVCVAWNLFEHHRPIIFGAQQMLAYQRDQQPDPCLKPEVSFIEDDFKVDFGRNRNDLFFEPNSTSNFNNWQPYNQDYNAGRMFRDTCVRRQPYRQRHQNY